MNSVDNFNSVGSQSDLQSLHNKRFYLCSLAFFMLAGVALATVSKADGFILLNGFHSFGLNVFFVNYTFFGDGLFSLAICSFLFYKKQRRLAIYLLVAFLSSGLFVQLLKQIIYAPRPRVYFEASQYLFRMDNFGNSGGGENGFPSGHTCSAFALATVLALHYKNALLSILLFLAAMLVGYSRIYLAQHFPADVVAGAFIGTLFAAVSRVLIEQKIKFSFNNKIKHPKAEWNNQLPEAALS